MQLLQITRHAGRARDHLGRDLRSAPVRAARGVGFRTAPILPSPRSGSQRAYAQNGSGALKLLRIRLPPRAGDGWSSVLPRSQSPALATARQTLRQLSYDPFLIFRARRLGEGTMYFAYGINKIS